MDLIHAELLATGARIAPLTTLDEIAAFFHAAAAVGQAAPARATAIAQRLGGSLADAASMFASILPTLPSMPNVERLLSMLPPCESMSIGPNRDTCAVCEHGMLEPSEYYTTAPLLSAKGLVKQVRLFKRKCSCCHAEHHLSYATGGLRLQRGEQVPSDPHGSPKMCVTEPRELGIQNPESRIQNTDGAPTHMVLLRCVSLSQGS